LKATLKGTLEKGGIRRFYRGDKREAIITRVWGHRGQDGKKASKEKRLSTRAWQSCRDSLHHPGGGRKLWKRIGRQYVKESRSPSSEYDRLVDPKWWDGPGGTVASWGGGSWRR